jgi:SH3-like domain-containing protein
MKRLIILIVSLFILLPALGWAEMMSVKNRWINFREGPSTSKAIVYKADRYYPVKVIGRKGGWLQVVDYQGDRAWVLGRLLGKVECVAVNVSKANVRKLPDIKSQVLFTASQGAAFKVIKKQGKWLLIQHADGDKGWIHTSVVWGL